MGGIGLKDCTYLDNLTVRPILTEAREAVEKDLSRPSGDPGSTNSSGRCAGRVLEDLRQAVAGFFGAADAEFFVNADLANGATVLSMGRRALESGRNRIATCPLERSAVVEALKLLQGEGALVDTLPAASDCRIDLQEAESIITDDTGLVVCSWADGTAGVVQPVEEIAGIASRTGSWMHSDASFAAGRIPVGVSDGGVGSMVISSPQLGGPHGCAALLLRDGQPRNAFITPDYVVGSGMHEISGMVAALESMQRSMDTRSRIVDGFRRDLLAGLDSCGLSYSIIGSGTKNVLPGTALLELNRRIHGLHARIELENIVLPAHNSRRRLSFLRRIGRDLEYPDRYLGFSIDHRNSSLDIEHFVMSLTEICNS